MGIGPAGQVAFLLVRPFRLVAAAVGGGQADEPRTGLNSVEMLLTIGVGPHAHQSLAPR